MMYYRRAHRPVQPENTYDTQQMGPLLSAAAVAEEQHLLAAADYVARVLTSSGISIRRPAGLVAGVMRIFVTVGGPHNPGISECIVEVDIIIQGSLGTPDDLSNAGETMSTMFQGSWREFNLLNIQGVLVAKLDAYAARASPSDYHDLEYLGKVFPSRVYEVRKQLKKEHRESFINEYKRKNSDADLVRKMKRTFGVK
ncbi:hypothetical protein BBP40_005463 [Aspergillus hancockii]|nr:hypothetical protein BBP40_005463 [Aspergillus hancockii]